MSEPAPVISGVPQGSVLGPLIFLILIGDIDKNITNSSVRSFADDTRLIRSIKNIEDTEALQEDLTTVYNWASVNNMKFNDIKFELLRYGTNNNIKQSTSYTSSNDNEIPEKQKVRDLGVVMTNDGKFKTHINETIQNAKKISSWILRTFKSCSPTPMLTLWKSLVLPKLEYCSQLWSPWQKDIQNLEIVQWSFIRKINDHHLKTYWDRLKNYKIYSLERRRERYQIIYIWKILEHLVPNINESDGIKPIFFPRLGRLCFIKSKSSTAPVSLQNMRHHFLATHGAILFNSIPKNLRNMSNCPVTTFKRQLDRYLSIIPDEPDIHGYTACKNATSNSIAKLSSTVRDFQLEEGRSGLQADISLFT